MSAVGCGGLVPRHCRLTSRNGGRVGGPPFFVLRRFLAQADRRCQPLPISSMHLETEIARWVFQWLAFPHPHPCNFSGQHSPADTASFRRAVRKEPEFVVQICLTTGRGGTLSGLPSSHAQVLLRQFPRLFVLHPQRTKSAVAPKGGLYEIFLEMWCLALDIGRKAFRMGYSIHSFGPFSD